MIGKLKDLAFGRGGEQIITLAVRDDFREQFDALADCEVDVEIKKRRKRRSLDANAYAWVLIDRLASNLSVSRSEVYRDAIRSIGGVSETVCVRSEAFERLERVWCQKGVGWQVERLPSKIDGCTNAILYFGSSTYDTKQMSDLIDHLIQNCKAVGIETDTPEEIEKIKSLWATSPKKGNEQ